jgi:Domain of unknown function (DUF5666)
MKRYISSALILAAFALPAAARADSYNYATHSGNQTLHGVITSIDGKYGLTVRDDRDGSDSITLHRGTVIDPTGLQLHPGMQVSIAGHRAAGTFDADKIEAPAEDLAAQERWRQAPLNVGQWSSFSDTNGTFQTNGPSAEGGG